jgi:hypothetical protein
VDNASNRHPDNKAGVTVTDRMTDERADSTARNLGAP